MPVSDKLKVYEIDYTSEEVPESVRTLRPIVYQDGNSYCCMIGLDPEAGIFGCGDTPEEAMQDWDKHYQEEESRTS